MEAKMKILIVEDDEILAKELQKYLKKWNYEVETVMQFEHIIEEFLESSPNLVLLDINLPFYDGFYWCRKIREISEIPILFISSRTEDMDKIMGIAQGGDDYIEKPFHLEVLRAKVDAAFRRAYQYKVKEKIVISDGLLYDIESQNLYFQSEKIDLTRTEMRILAKLFENRNKVVTREDLMMELWNTDEYVSDGTLTTVISRLRTKLKKRCGNDLICTKKGLGYFVE